MEDEVTIDAEQVTPAIDYTDPNQVMAVVQEQGAELAIALLSALAIFIIGRWAAHLVVKMIRRALARTDMEDTLEHFLCNILNAILMTVVLIATIGALGVETTSLLAVLGAAGLAIGLALQGSLSNFAAGVLIVAFKPYKVGDFIEAGGQSGTVNEVQIFTTILTTPDNKKIIIPNAQVMSGSITNYSTMGTRRVDMVFGIGYDDDIDKAYAALKQIIEADERVLKDPAYTIALNELADSSVNFIVRPWCDSGDYWGVYNDTHEAVKRKFDEAGISIPYPQQDVHLYQHTS